MAGRWTALSALALALAGCAAPVHTASPPCLPPGRSLVLARVVSHANRSTAEGAAIRLANALRPSADMLNLREFESEAKTAGLGAWASSVAGLLESGGRLRPEDGTNLREQFGITTLLATEVTEFDQSWGRYTKYTRVGLEASAFDLGSERVMWRRGNLSEIEDKQGWAFEAAMARAVDGLAGSICPPPPKSFPQEVRGMTKRLWNELTD